ncbi:Hypothetical protein D9617_15g043810 [Elsinoe fawcettii]|nr:Hypothetical protein D9617_15g043810 [Elsinoe fawcettii]
MSAAAMSNPLFVCSKAYRLRTDEQSEGQSQDDGPLLCDQILYCYVDTDTNEPICFYLGNSLSLRRMNDVDDDEPHEYRDDLMNQVRSIYGSAFDLDELDRYFNREMAGKKPKPPKSGPGINRHSPLKPLDDMPETVWQTSTSRIYPEAALPGPTGIDQPTISAETPPHNIFTYIFWNIWFSLVWLLTFTQMALGYFYIYLQGWFYAFYNSLLTIKFLSISSLLLALLYTAIHQFRLHIWERWYPPPPAPPSTPTPVSAYPITFVWPSYKAIFSTIFKDILHGTDYVYDHAAKARDQPSFAREAAMALLIWLSSFTSVVAFVVAVIVNAILYVCRDTGGNQPSYIATSAAELRDAARKNRAMVGDIARAWWGLCAWPSWSVMQYRIAQGVHWASPAIDAVARVWGWVKLAWYAPGNAYRSFSFRRHVLRKAVVLPALLLLAVFSAWMAETGAHQIKEWWELRNVVIEPRFRPEWEVNGYGGWLPRWVGAGPTVTVHMTEKVGVTETKEMPVTRTEVQSVTVFQTKEASTMTVTDWKTETQTETVTERETRTVKVSPRRHRRNQSSKAHTLLGIEPNTPTRTSVSHESRTSRGPRDLLSRTSARDSMSPRSPKAHAILGIEPGSPVEYPTRTTRHSQLSQKSPKSHVFLGIESRPAQERALPPLPLRKYDVLGLLRSVDKSLPPSPSSSILETPAELYTTFISADSEARKMPKKRRVLWEKQEKEESVPNLESDREEEEEEIESMRHAEKDEVVQTWVKWVSSVTSDLNREQLAEEESEGAEIQEWRDDEIDADDLYFWYGGFGCEDAMYEPDEPSDTLSSIMIGFA